MKRFFALLAAVLLTAAACSGEQRQAVRQGFSIAGAEVSLAHDTVVLTPPSGEWRLSLRTATIAGAALAPSHATSAELERITLHREGVDEWYRRVPRGLQHGYTLHQRPAGDLTIDLEVRDLEVRQLAPDRLGLFDAQGRQRLAYGELHAWDASGKVLPAEIAATDGHIRLRIDHTGANYPVYVDPTAWVVQASLLPSDTNGFFFADAVALEGDTAFVGEQNDTAGGAVYVFTFSQGLWTEQQKLVPAGIQMGDWIGASVDVDGERLAIGGPRFDHAMTSQTGAAWIYQRAGGVWSEAQALTPADGANDGAGTSVAISADFAAVGAPDDDDGGSNAGAVYVYTLDSGGWVLDDKLVAPDATASSSFGERVALDGDTLAVAAPFRASGGVADSGAVYVYRRDASGWMLEQTIESSFLKLDGWFGRSIALEGDRLLIGQANGGAVPPHLPGMAFLWTRAGTVWSEEAVLAATGIAYGDGYGNTLDLDGDVAVVGAARADLDIGRVTVFRHAGATWLEEASLHGPAPMAYDDFGAAAAVDGGRVLVGAPADADAGVDEGQAFVFALVGNACAVDGECASGICADDVCCSTPCDGGCAQCDATGDEGVCVPRPEGTTGECSPHLCDGSSLECTPCGDEGECIADHYCQGGICHPEKALGEPCAAGDECDSALCVDDHCCDEACGSQCLACDVPGSEGTCSPVTGEPHGAREPCREDFCDATDHVAYAGFTCAGGATCQPSSSIGCQPYTCGPTACRDRCLSNEHCIVEGETCFLPEHVCRRNETVCDGDHTLLEPDGGEQSCVPFRCGETNACYTSCTTTAHCADGFVCDTAGTCIEPPPLSVDEACACRAAGLPPSSSTPVWWLTAILLTSLGRSSDRSRCCSSSR